MTMGEVIRRVRRKLLGSEPAEKRKTEELAEDVRGQTQLLREELEEIRQDAKEHHGGDLLAALVHAMNRNRFLDEIKEHGGKLPD